ncbi:Protein-S-isoprenylcysteine O-methyltransferase [Mycena indigotica]|uniref:Protein-S-isoprenylcysteine O-methyltransferase n=1 Tax=Mycena indigotica TaxID=2126181 RepID=A0A8H6SQ49_9AGAR|nr:Protein-S-isoprenylcysteine O-methyltransferase [Mycena indigotica]KAF7303471.1 Protein-S-isoprenylcysteine O-methyltransferase [Mycena indigotica]
MSSTSGLKIPLLLAVAAGAHVTMTPPNPPPAEKDRLPPSGLEHAAPRLFPLLLKGFFWTCGIAEIALLAAEHLSGSLLSADTATQILRRLDPLNASGKLSLTTPFLIGAAFNLLGSALRLHCYARLRHFFTFELALHPEQHLVTNGVYGLVRHPSYTGALLSGVGVALCTLTPGSWAVECLLGPKRGALSTLWISGIGLACVGLRSRMKKEDQMLKDRFEKEWDDWARKNRVMCTFSPFLLTTTSSKSMDSEGRTRSTSPPPRPFKRSRDGPGPQRHPTLYLDAADLCVIRVKQTLFKIHRSFLLNMQAVPEFSVLFERQGTTDDDPVDLLDDAPEDFAALLKFVCRGPHPQYTTPPFSELSDVFGIGRLAIKYDMPDWKTWVSTAIYVFACNHKDELTSSNFVTSFDIAHGIKSEHVQGAIVEAWLPRLSSGNLPIGPALKAAAKHNNRPFLAALYENELKKLSAAPLDQWSLSGMDNVHQKRILAGYYSLSTRWTAFSAMPLTGSLPIAKAACRPPEPGQHSATCLSSFTAAWNEALGTAVEAYPRVHQMRERVAQLQRTLEETSKSQSRRGICRYSKTENDALSKECEKLTSYERYFFAMR